jgi:hypothetical protein
MELKLHIQQTPQYNIQQQQIYYDGPNPQQLNVFTGALPQPRRWKQYNSFIDVTHDVSDLFKLKLTWTNDRDRDGIITPGAFQPKKAVSGSLTFEGEAYRLIKQWLIDDVSAPLNSVSVKIEHVGLGSYLDYVFKAADLRWCEESVCMFDITLKQKEEALSCIQRTLIADNHQGWFPERYPTTPANGKKHPRFSYCNEIRPNGQLVLMWFVGGMTWTITALFMVALIPIINSIIAIILIIVKIINVIIDVVNTFGGSIKKLKEPTFTTIGDIIDDFEQKFVESAGCGREHPAPLIRDYISNVCKLCNVEVNETTAPIFFAQHFQIETSGRGVINTVNHHYNACYLYAPLKRGIRRFHNINAFQPQVLNDHDFWIPDNQPLLTLDLFLDELKTVYNAEWRITTVQGKPTLFFQRKDYYVNGGYVLDLAPNGADRLALLEGMCFEWNEAKYPATCQGIWSQDPVDTCGNEAMQPMNGPMVFFGNTDKNPNFEGILDKSVQFGATKFRLDGASTDYLYDAMQVVINSVVINPILFLPFKLVVAPAIREFADYALLLKDDTCGMPKILIWDGGSYTNARAVMPFSGYPIDPANGPKMPDINTPYNNYPKPTPWHERHETNTFVIGSKMTFGNHPKGYYKVQDLFGIVVSEQPALLPNYFMYFEPGYEDTLWDWFHWIDDPLRNPKMNMKFTARLELCPSTLKQLKVFGDGLNVALGHKVKLPGKYYTDGRIKEIEVSYDTENDIGQYIQVKGEL